MITSEQVEQQQALLDAHRRTLHHIRIQLAEKGTYCPPHILVDEEFARTEIAQIKDVLRSWGVEVDDLQTDLSPVFNMGKDPGEPIEELEASVLDEVEANAELETTHQPPQSLEYFLQRCAGRKIEQLLGDLEEQYNIVYARTGERNAQRWYRAQVLRSCGSFIVERFTRWSWARVAR